MIFTKMTVYNLAGNSHFWAWSNFNSFANFGPLKANDCALKSPDQGGVIFANLARGWNNYKNRLLLSLGQTDSTIFFLCYLFTTNVFGV